MVDHHGSVSAALDNAFARLGTVELADIALLIRDKDALPQQRADLVNAACELVPQAVTIYVSSTIPHGATAHSTRRIAGIHRPDEVVTVGFQQQPGGCSRHSVSDAVAAAAAGAHYVQLGPIWSTPSKIGMGEPIGTTALQQARAAFEQAQLPTLLVAVGGIMTTSHAACAHSSGAHAVAIIRAVWTSLSPSDTLTSFVDTMS
jgi:thiamine monophosphate synthase